jgi:hypothetical protein
MCTFKALRRAGFELDFGIDGAGISRAYFTRGGGYYIDVGIIVSSGENNNIRWQRVAIR